MTQNFETNVAGCFLINQSHLVLLFFCLSAPAFYKETYERCNNFFHRMGHLVLLNCIFGHFCFWHLYVTFTNILRWVIVSSTSFDNLSNENLLFWKKPQNITLELLFSQQPCPLRLFCCRTAS